MALAEPLEPPNDLLSNGLVHLLEGHGPFRGEVTQEARERAERIAALGTKHDPATPVIELDDQAIPFLEAQTIPNLFRDRYLALLT